MPSKSILFLRATNAPHYLTPVSVIYHPEMPSPRYEVLWRVRGKEVRADLKTQWFSSKKQAFDFAKERHEVSDGLGIL